jgi:hypothetical protein
MSFNIQFWFKSKLLKSSEHRLEQAVCNLQIEQKRNRMFEPGKRLFAHWERHQGRAKRSSQCVQPKSMMRENSRMDASGTK